MVGEFLTQTLALTFSRAVYGWATFLKRHYGDCAKVSCANIRRIFFAYFIHTARGRPGDKSARDSIARFIPPSVRAIKGKSAQTDRKGTEQSPK